MDPPSGGAHASGVEEAAAVVGAGLPATEMPSRSSRLANAATVVPTGSIVRAE